MLYYIQVDSNNVVVATYSGYQVQSSPWISIVAAQFGMIVPGCTWSGAAVVAPTVPTLSVQQQLTDQAQALIAGGIAVTSIGTPSLNGTYATDSRAQANMLGVVSYINANGKFPGSAGALTWYDMDGQPHVFSSASEFMALYSAGLDFVMDCQLVADASAGTLPSATATIP